MTYEINDVIRLREYGVNFECKCTDLRYLYGAIGTETCIYDLDLGILRMNGPNAKATIKRYCSDYYNQRGQFISNNSEIYQPDRHLSSIYHRVIKFISNPTTDTDKFTKGLNSLGYTFNGKLQANYLGGWNVIDSEGNLQTVSYLLSHLSRMKEPGK